MWNTLPETLPSSLGEADSASTGALSDRRTQPSVLLLDDDPFMLGIQSRMLRSMGYSMVGTATSAEAALMRLRNDPLAVDVIICDLNMPGMDGIEFVQNLAASAFRGSVVLLSGEGVRIMHTVQRMVGGKVQILGALEKPAGRAELQALLDCWKPMGGAASTASTPSFTPDEVHAAARSQQWVLHYQPKVYLATGELACTEALVRWNHPDHGLIYPDHFIDLAEQCDAIGSLTEWVLQEAIKQQVRWRSAGLQIEMSVNVSMHNLHAADFARRVNKIVNDNGSSAQYVTLEVTESRLMVTSSIPLENLARLRMQRFGLSIDDFGTGHSSLAQLRDVPFTELKIDRGFVRGARHNQAIRPILEGSIGIANRLGMQSAAEGVESEDDWHLLCEIGCDLAQGNFIGRAMPSDRIPVWLPQWQLRHAGLIGA